MTANTSPWLSFFSPETEKENAALAKIYAQNDAIAKAKEKAKAPSAPAANLYADSLKSGDAEPTGASDYFGPSAVALANENLNSPEARNYLAKLEKSQEEAIGNQRAGISSAQGNLDMYNKLPVQYDLSPLMNLSDSWFGSNLAKGYKAPSSVEEKISARATLEGALNKARMGLTEAEKDRLQQNLTNRQKTSQVLNEAAIADAKRYEQKRDDKTRNDYKKEQQKNQQFIEYDKNFASKIRGLADVRDASANLKFIVGKYNGAVPEFGTPDYLEYKSEMSKLLVAYNRHKAELGALAGGDLDLLRSTVADDESYAKNALKQFAFNKRMDKIIDNVAADTDKAASQYMKQSSRYEKYVPEEYKGTNAYYENSKLGRYGSVQASNGASPISKEDESAILKGIK